MKKLMVALAAVAFAVSAQAVAVQWDTYTVYAAGEGGTGWDPSGDGVYDAVGATLAAQYKTAVIFSASADLSDPIVSATVTGLGEDSNAAAKTADLFTKGETYYGQVVVTSADGNSTLSSEIFTFSIDKNYAKETYYVGISDGGDGIELVSGADLDNDYGAFQTTGWQSVPEPTSGLLLLLGVAGLALRRRRA